METRNAVTDKINECLTPAFMLPSASLPIVKPAVLEAACRIVEGTARQMGITIENYPKGVA